MTVSAEEVPALPVRPEHVREKAAEVERLASRFELAIATTTTRWAAVVGAYEAPETEALRSRLIEVGPTTSEIAAGLRLARRAFDDLADDLGASARSRDALLADIEDYHRISPLHGTSPAQRESQAMLGLPRATPLADELQRRCDRLAAEIASAIEGCAAALRGVPPPVRALSAALADHADTTAAASGSSITDAVGLTLLRRLAADGGAHAADLWAAHPRWAELLRRSPAAPEAVAVWWRTLDPATAAAIASAAPALIGNLDGIDIATRITVNRERAACTIAKLLQEQQDLGTSVPHGGRTQPAVRPGWIRRLNQITLELEYFRAVVRGDKQVFAWDSDKGSLIEMSGDPASAKAALFVVPGTNTSVHSFMEKQPVTAFADWQARNGPAGVVAFTILTGPMPHISLDMGDMSEHGPQRNDFADRRGVEYASFIRGISSSSPDLWLMSYEHSYGTAVGSAAERSGGSLDARFLAAGVGAAGAYRPDPTTSYYAAQSADDINRYYAGVEMGPLGFGTPPESFENVTIMDSGQTGPDPAKLLSSGAPGTLSIPMMILDSVAHHTALMSDDARRNSVALAQAQRLLERRGR